MRGARAPLDALDVLDVEAPLDAAGGGGERAEGIEQRRAPPRLVAVADVGVHVEPAAARAEAAATSRRGPAATASDDVADQPERLTRSAVPANAPSALRALSPACTAHRAATPLACRLRAQRRERVGVPLARVDVRRARVRK